MHDTARLHPQRVVFAEGGNPTMLKAAVQAKAEGICQPILLGNPDRLNRVASRLKLDLSDIEIIDMRADNEQGRRATFAKHRQRSVPARVTPSRRLTTRCMSATTSVCHS